MTQPQTQSSQSLPWWKKTITIASVIGIILTTCTIYENFRLKPVVEPLEKNLALSKENSSKLEKDITDRDNKIKDKDNTIQQLADERKELRAKLYPLEENDKLKGFQENIALFSGYEISYNPKTKDIAVGLGLSEQNKKQIASSTPTKIEAVVIFAPGQEFVNLWIIDATGKGIKKILRREEGKVLIPEREDERFFELLISNFQGIDKSDISKISFEARIVPGNVKKKVFVVKRVNLK